MTPKIRCKFKVQTITLVEGGEQLVAVPVSSGSNENDEFFKYSPAGSLELETVNQHLLTERLQAGQEFYLDLIPIQADA